MMFRRHRAPVADMNKVAGKGPKGLGDACKLEFDYTCNRKGVESIVALVMEPRCRNTKAWGGPVGGYLGGRLYLDFTMDDGDAFEAGVHKLVAEVRKLQAAAELHGNGSSSRLLSNGKRNGLPPVMPLESQVPMKYDPEDYDPEDYDPEEYDTREYDLREYNLRDAAEYVPGEFSPRMYDTRQWAPRECASRAYVPDSPHASPNLDVRCVQPGRQSPENRPQAIRPGRVRREVPVVLGSPNRDLLTAMKV